MESSTILNLISTITFVGSLVFAGIQVRNAQKQRSREAAVQLMHSIVSPDFLKAMRLVLSIPDGLSMQEVNERLQNQMDALFYFLGTCESLGILVYHRELKLELIDDILSGPLLLSWGKLKQYVYEYRNELQRQTMYEWFQWLAERMNERESKYPPVPAYVAQRTWHE